MLAALVGVIVLAALVGVIVVAALVLYVIGGSRVNNTYDGEVAAVVIPLGDGAVERGRHVVETFGLCQECHGKNLGGDILEDDPMFGTLAPSNLTSGAGGTGWSFTDVDYVRTIRHGVGPSGKPLVLMPSEFYNRLSDADLGDVIAYLKALPPVDNQQPKTKLGPLGRVITLLDATLLPAGLIDHDPPRPAATICSVCHGENLSGGTVPGEASDAPQAPNLTPAGSLASSWDEADFTAALRTGVTPDGRTLDPEMMPWVYLPNAYDEEVQAIWAHVQSLPAREFGE